jgi:hypothetical protein
MCLHLAMQSAVIPHLPQAMSTPAVFAMQNSVPTVIESTCQESTRSFQTQLRQRDDRSLNMDAKVGSAN